MITDILLALAALAAWLATAALAARAITRLMERARAGEDLTDDDTFSLADSIREERCPDCLWGRTLPDGTRVPGFRPCDRHRSAFALPSHHAPRHERRADTGELAAVPDELARRRGQGAS
jgi:hypothetical protein